MTCTVDETAPGRQIDRHSIRAGDIVQDFMMALLGYWRDIPLAGAGDTIIEVIRNKAQRSQLVAATKNARLHGVVTASRLPAAALTS